MTFKDWLEDQLPVSVRERKSGDSRTDYKLDPSINMDDDMAASIASIIGGGSWTFLAGGILLVDARRR